MKTLTKKLGVIALLCAFTATAQAALIIKSETTGGVVPATNLAGYVLNMPPKVTSSTDPDLTAALLNNSVTLIIKYTNDKDSYQHQVGTDTHPGDVNNPSNQLALFYAASFEGSIIRITQVEVGYKYVETKNGISKTTGDRRMSINPNLIFKIDPVTHKITPPQLKSLVDGTYEFLMF